MDDDLNGEDFGGECADYDFYSDPNNFESQEEFEKFWEEKQC